MPVAKWVDKQGGEKWDFIILLAAGVSGIIYTFYLLFVDTIIEFYAFEVFAGLVDGFMMAAFYAIFSHHIDKESQGFEWSLFSILGITIAVATSSFFGGRIADMYGFKPLFMLAGTLNVLGALVLVFLNKHMRVMRKVEHYKKINDDESDEALNAS
jgi:MFS family permease